MRSFFWDDDESQEFLWSHYGHVFFWIIAFKSDQINSSTPRDLEHFGNRKIEKLPRSLIFMGKMNFQSTCVRYSIWQNFHSQFLFPNCEKTGHDWKFLKPCVDLYQSVKFKNGIILENWSTNSWLMSNLLHKWKLSCTRFHVTFFSSNRVFLSNRFFLFNISIFSWKSTLYLKIQLWISKNLYMFECKLLLYHNPHQLL